MNNKITVEFEDDGQDFLEWDLDRDDRAGHTYQPIENSYIVVGCRPFQEEVWKGTRVHIDHQSIGAGILLEVTLPGKTTRTHIVHRVKQWRVRN